ncbi:MAG: hypothetical protein H6976_16625 [Gammaproteobacteria bacterium]|nr:hypothetical protein [Gammaproteobacteria bacterium]
MKKITRKPKAEMRVLSVRVPLPLFEELQAFREALQAFDDTMIFNINELMVTALKRDLRVAWDELENLKGVKRPPPLIRQTTLDSGATVPSPAAPSATATREVLNLPATQVSSQPAATPVQPGPRVAEGVHQRKPV